MIAHHPTLERRAVSNPLWQVEAAWRIVNPILQQDHRSTPTTSKAGGRQRRSGSRRRLEAGSNRAAVPRHSTAHVTGERGAMRTGHTRRRSVRGTQGKLRRGGGLVSDRNEPDPRVYFAAQRTFLAWIRTGLALMGFGFVVARFGLFLRENQRRPGRRRTDSRLFTMVRHRLDRVGGAADRRGVGVAHFHDPTAEQWAAIHRPPHLARRHACHSPRRDRCRDDDLPCGVESAVAPSRLAGPKRRIACWSANANPAVTSFEAEASRVGCRTGSRQDPRPARPIAAQPLTRPEHDALVSAAERAATRAPAGAVRPGSPPRWSRT